MTIYAPSLSAMPAERGVSSIIPGKQSALSPEIGLPVRHAYLSMQPHVGVPCLCVLFMYI
jgi:hypothetical protein